MSYRGLGVATTSGACATGQGSASGIQRLISTWGAWPDTQCPGWLYISDPSAGTVSTHEALLSLKKQAVGLGVLGGIVGLTLGWTMGRRAR